MPYKHTFKQNVLASSLVCYYLCVILYKRNSGTSTKNCKNQRQTDPLLKIRARVVTQKISHV